MNNTRSFTLIRLAGLALLATALSAGLLSAEDYEGKFTLPFEARWGLATLPPGDYSFRLDTANARHLAKVYGKNGGFLVWPVGVSDVDVPGRNELIIVRTGRAGRIRALHLAEPGLLFSYAAPKSERQMLAQAPELIQRIPVAVSGK